MAIEVGDAPLLRRRCSTFQASAGIMDSLIPNRLALTFFHSGPSNPSAPGAPAENAQRPPGKKSKPLGVAFRRHHWTNNENGGEETYRRMRGR